MRTGRPAIPQQRNPNWMALRQSWLPTGSQRLSGDIMINKTIALLLVAIGIIAWVNWESNSPEVRFSGKERHTIEVKYGNDDWVVMNNVIKIRKPNRYRNILTIVLDDGTVLNIVGGTARWKGHIPEF